MRRLVAALHAVVEDARLPTKFPRAFERLFCEAFVVPVDLVVAQNDREDVNFAGVRRAAVCRLICARSSGVGAPQASLFKTNPSFNGSPPDVPGPRPVTHSAPVGEPRFYFSGLRREETRMGEFHLVLKIDVIPNELKFLEGTPRRRSSIRQIFSITGRSSRR